MNGKLIVSTILACSVFCTNAYADAKEQSQRKVAESRIAQLGGFVNYPNSQKGYVGFINAQEDVDFSEELQNILGPVNRHVPVNFRFLTVKFSTPKTIKKSANVNFAIIIKADKDDPPSMIAPEEGYAIVNVLKYREGLKLPEDLKIYKNRCAKAVLKSFLYLCGGCASKYPGYVGSAHSVRDLDLMHTKVPVDIQTNLRKYLSDAGVTPMRKTIYRRAVEEGWAPAPTNDIQKAIWDKIHAMPTAPIKIKPETKKVTR